MKTVTELTERFVKAEKEVMDTCMKEMGFDFIKVMDESNFKLIQQTLKLMDAANELLVAQAKVLDEMNEKLNKLDYIAKKIEA
jgi:deoxyxylulose-5-phosphate synthase